jgi:hypothetical protein
VYLPTTFMEEAYPDPACLPINCEMVVERDGVLVPGEKHHVTIKAVPRQVRGNCVLASSSNSRTKN